MNFLGINGRFGVIDERSDGKGVIISFRQRSECSRDMLSKDNFFFFDGFITFNLSFHLFWHLYIVF